MSTSQSMDALHQAVREALDLYRRYQADEILARAAFGLAAAHVQRIADVDVRTAVFLLELEVAPLLSR